MSKWLAVVTVCFLLVFVASSGANAGSLFVTGSQSVAYVTVPLYSANPSEQFAAGKLQFDAFYRGQLIWSYDGTTGEYAGVYPIGMGQGNNITLHLYPNVETRNLAVEAVAVGEAELASKLASVYDRKSKTFQFKLMKGLYPIERSADDDNRFAGDITFDDSVGEGSHVLRVYALVRDAKREDKAFLVIFHWASRKPGVGLVDTLRFRTEKWPANTPAPLSDYLTDLLARAGNVGNGQIFSRLLVADRADAAQAAADAQERQRTQAVNAALTAEVEAALNSATNYSIATTAVLSQQDARLKQVEGIANGHADSVNTLAANQRKLAAGVDKNSQGIADLGAKVEVVESWIAQASRSTATPTATPAQPAMPATPKTVHFTIAFVSGANQSPTTVEVECASGVKLYSVMEYLKYGFQPGTVMDFRIRKPRGPWQSINFTVIPGMDGGVKVIPVQ